MNRIYILTIVLLFWFASQSIANGPFDKPGLPPGTHLTGIASKGTLTYIVNPSLTPQATLQFSGTCGKNKVNTTAIDVTPLTDVNAFASLTDKQIESALENFFSDNSIFVNPFNGANCFNHTAIGIYTVAINKTLTKTNTVWVGEVTIAGVQP